LCFINAGDRHKQLEEVAVVVEEEAEVVEAVSAEGEGAEVHLEGWFWSWWF
jgi:hypothetical protein